MRKCVCLWRALGLFQKSCTRRAQHPTIYRGWINRLEWNSIAPPPFFPLSLPQDSPSVFSILTQEEKSQQKFFKREKEEKTLWGRRKCGDGIFTTGRHTQKRGGECQTIAKKKDPRFIQRHTRRDGRRRRRFGIFMKRISASSLYYAAQDYIYVKVENKVLLEGETILN